MKKTNFFALIAALLAIAVILCSCGTQKENNTTQPSVTNPHETNISFKAAILQYDNDYCSSQMRQAFIARMRTLGYDEAKMKFDIINSNGSIDRLNENANSLVGSDYSIIIALGTLAAKSVADTENKIPCVFIGAQDPVGNGLTSDLEAPDKNITGAAFRCSNDTLLAIMRVYTTNVSSIAVLNFENNNFSKADTDALKMTLEESAYTVQTAEIKENDDIAALVSELCQSVDAFYIPEDERFEKSYVDIIKIATENQKIIFTTSESAIKDGALLGAFTKAESLAQSAALTADRVLQGKELSQIPVSVETEISLFVNRQAATNFSVEVPRSDNLILV